MKKSQDIDELLNGFIDDELPPRQHTEVQRLIYHDPEIADRLHQLQRCKMLLGALPEAHRQLTAGVSYSVEVSRALREMADRFDREQGTTG